MVHLDGFLYSFFHLPWPQAECNGLSATYFRGCLTFRIKRQEQTRWPRSAVVEIFRHFWVPWVCAVSALVIPQSTLTVRNPNIIILMPSIKQGFSKPCSKPKTRHRTKKEQLTVCYLYSTSYTIFFMSFKTLNCIMSWQWQTKQRSCNFYRTQFTM